MQQDSVKEILLQIRPDVEEFFVLFTGKQSKKVNGLYKPESREILIHNRNFTDDNALLYTAIHEFAHHVHFTSSGRPVSNRSHTVEFRSILHGLLETAEARGLYRNAVDGTPELRQLAESIRNRFMRTNGELMKEFGKALMEAELACRQHGARFEDFIERALQLPRTAAGTIMKITALDLPEELGYENMRTLAGIRSNQVRSEATAAFREGLSSDQVKLGIQHQQAVAREADPRRRLSSEQRRIERTLERLQARLGEIRAALERMGLATEEDDT